jgi:hypothetical protein
MVNHPTADCASVHQVKINDDRGGQILKKIPPRPGNDTLPPEEVN